MVTVQTNLFGEAEHRRFAVDVLPISVLEIGKTRTSNRETGEHDEKSSRDAYSGFPCEIGTLCYQLYLKNSELVFDPFAGWGERARLAAEQCFASMSGTGDNSEFITILLSGLSASWTIAGLPRLILSSGVGPP